VTPVEAWRTALRGDPLDWLLEPEHPAVRHLALRQLADEPEDAYAVRRARAAAMRTRPIAAILDAQDPEGWWVDPRLRYDGAKYRGWLWPLMFLEQMGADPRDRRIQRACRYALDHGQAQGGGFGWSQADSGVAHCLTGHTLRALIAFGHLDDPRVTRAIAWEAGAITGVGHERWYPWATSGPGFGCGINGGHACAWGAAKAVHALAAIPPRRRTRAARDAIAAGTEFLLSVDPATGAYPTGTKISANWFKLGFPSGYMADALEVAEALAELGKARDPRLTGVVELVLEKQDGDGRWRNERDYRGRLWTAVDTKGRPSKWVTLRAARFLRAALG
jgi:hypothetical protein